MTDPNYGVSITPILSYQLEAIVQDHILAQKQSKIFRDLNIHYWGKPGTFIVNFLATFVLLHNCDMILDQQRRFTKPEAEQVTKFHSERKETY